MLAAISRHYVNLPQPSLNGVDDEPTAEAVKRIQRSLGITDTGETNQETWIILSCYFAAGADSVSRETLLQDQKNRLNVSKRLGGFPL